MVADIANQTYVFSMEITATNLRPDIIVWKANTREAWLLELSVVFESFCYIELLRMANQQYRAKLFHLLIESRGMVFEEMKTSLAKLWKPKHTF